MSLIFVHLSDIHFGQERGSSITVHDDVKDQLIADARDYMLQLDNKKATGIIISGDVAYAGQPLEYDTAAHWLDELAAAVGCEKTAVQVVPGNHDIDRERVTAITQTIINEIAENGDEALDKYLEHEDDREFIYKQFKAYRSFAEGYDCPLDAYGKISRLRTFEVAPGRQIKFLGMNTALICSKSKNEEGKLILGGRQRVIPKEDGLETVVIAHHPLNWLLDSEDAKRYIRNRARVFISGHEHTPSHKCEEIDDNSDLLMLASGAAVPPDTTNGYNYCYNFLEFDWKEADDALMVTIHGRTWDDNKKKFVSDDEHFEKGRKEYVLRSPNFKKLSLNLNDETIQAITDNVEDKPSGENYMTEIEEHIVEEKEFQIVLLKFFRDLTSAQRLSVLVDLGAIPSTWVDSLTHGLERTAFDKLVKEGKLEIMRDKINQILKKQ